MTNPVTTALPAQILALLAAHPELKIVSCVIRNGPSGWAVIETAGHQPIGVASVSQDAEGVTINYAFTATKVLGFTASVDEYYASVEKMMAGTSVGFSYAYMQFGKAGGAGILNPSTLSAEGNAQFVGLFL